MNGNNVTYFDSFGVATFQRKLRTSQETKISQQIFIEYNHMIQYYGNTFLMDLLILSGMIKG